MGGGPVTDQPAPALPPYPETERRDIAAIGAEAAAGLVPIVGGGLSPLIAATFGSALERRRDRWIQDHLIPMVEVASLRLNRSAEELADDDVFVSAVIHASRDALGTHVEDKLRMFRNVLAHHLLDPVRGNVVTLRFVRWVDELEPDHLVVLAYAQDPRGWYDEHGLEQPNYMAASRRRAFDAAGLGLSAEVTAMVLSDLGTRGLADSSALSAMVTGGSVFDHWITARGAEWLQWVRDIALGE